MDAYTAGELTLVAGAAAAVARLIHLNLARRFPALLAYLAFVALSNFGFALLKATSPAYFWSYVLLEPLRCLVGLIAVRELFTLTLRDYPGIGTIGRWSMYAGVALALGLSLVFTGFFWNGTASGRAHSHLYYVEISQRSVVFTLAIAIIAILLVLSRYPLRLGWNTRVSSVFFSVLFLGESAQLMIDSFSPQLSDVAIDGVETGFISLCLLGWTMLLRPEPSTAPAQIRFSNPREEHLLEQLTALNQMLTRAARR